MQEISIYHKPGPFIFIVRDKDGKPLYVGGTENINQKVFKFAFEFADITGYYYDESFPDFWDEVDSKICKLKPKYNTRLHSSLPPKAVVKKVKEIFKKNGHSLSSSIRREILYELSECENFVFLGEVYVSGFDCLVIINTICEKYGIHNI